MDTTVDFRRKLLGFTRPQYIDYARHTIPRYYSNFGPRFNTRFKYVDCPDKGAEVYPINFAIDKVWEPDECSYCGLSNINPRLGHAGLMFWVYLVVLIGVMLMLVRARV